MGLFLALNVDREPGTFSPIGTLWWRVLIFN